MPRQVSPATIVYSNVGRGIGDGTIVSVEVGAEVLVSVRAVVGVLEGIALSRLPMMNVAP